MIIIIIIILCTYYTVYTLRKSNAKTLPLMPFKHNDNVCVCNCKFMFYSTAGVGHRQTGKTGGSLLRAPETSVEMTCDFSHINAGMSYIVSALWNCMLINNMTVIHIPYFCVSTISNTVITHFRMAVVRWYTYLFNNLLFLNTVHCLTESFLQELSCSLGEDLDDNETPP